ncbi:FadR/GntR family transcriptional regulator [Salipiger thiooxidans]|uniref:FadR/GntR family transcriptional regulator n=1 Tax=Salipiger thiooxidans TaxID=282683 RepID=UPI001CD66B5F|nr:FCD domain-containing protein [Salipiger thiooxidans]MCA0848511.1 FCD domain-containing protein [Salipiger thiooxidans]
MGLRINRETEAAALAGERRNDAAPGRIEQARDLLRDATGSMRHRGDSDFTVHGANSSASNNQYFDTTFRALRDHVDVGTKLHGESRLNSGPESLEDVLAEHADIVEAIRERRPEDARREMRHHLEHSRDQCLGGSVLGLRMR